MLVWHHERRILICAYHSVVKDKYHATEFKCDELEDLPRLLRLMLNIDPHLFKGTENEYINIAGLWAKFVRLETTPTKTAEQCLSGGQLAQQTKVEQEVVQSLNVHKRPAEEKHQKDTAQPSSPEYSVSIFDGNEHIEKQIIRIVPPNILSRKYFTL